ncbi:hypothetical protein SAY87_031515 [Trapa incisa]|uniref:C2 domain-containing protein n=1 Tax=Trapa incisa TaxID=236973 RepID=A0AAN7KKM5_9MYRT|nr:hypothetical protein SAY87_031515 [Trapa incisa]
MSISGIQGMPLEVTVVGCVRLKDTEWISRQDPYVFVEYGSNRQRTRTCTDGGKNPTFQEKFVLTLIEGLRELNVSVWNSNTLSADDFIGNGRVSLQKVLSQGYDDNSWTVQDKCGRYSGEVRLIMHYSYANANPGKIKTQTANVPPYQTPIAPPYQFGYPATAAYPGKSVDPLSYPPATTCPTSSYPAYPQGTPMYPPPPEAAVYPPAPVAGMYPPPAGYPTCPPPAYPQPYPPQLHTSVYPPGPPAGIYPPPPY